jgi:hypothetical protein
MKQSAQPIYQFCLARPAYRRISLQACSLAGAFLLCLFLGVAGGLALWPTYTHTFTWYLKWQDALLGSSWCLALVSLGGCILTLRFLGALHRGYRHGMIIMEHRQRLAGRDLSPKNFASILRAVSTVFACFVVMLVGLFPTFLLALTTHFPNPVLAFFSTIVAAILSLLGLALSLPFGAFFIIGLVGGVSFCRNMGALQPYTLHNQTTLRIDGFVLAVIHPDRPEALFDLQLLTPADQRQLLALLRECWQAAEPPWNPRLGDEIAAALKRTEYSTLSTPI